MMKYTGRVKRAFLFMKYLRHETKGHSVAFSLASLEESGSVPSTAYAFTFKREQGCVGRTDNDEEQTIFVNNFFGLLLLYSYFVCKYKSSDIFLRYFFSQSFLSEVDYRFVTVEINRETEREQREQAPGCSWNKKREKRTKNANQTHVPTLKH